MLILNVQNSYTTLEKGKLDRINDIAFLISKKIILVNVYSVKKLLKLSTDFSVNMRDIQVNLPHPAATKQISTPTSGRSRVGETRFPSGESLRRPMASQHVVPQNNSSPPFTACSTSTFFSASTADIFSQLRSVTG